MVVRRRSKVSLKKNLIRVGLGLLVAGVLLIGGLVGYYASNLPKVADVTTFERRPSVTMLSAEGDILATYGDLYGTPVRLADVPRDVINAVLATEDRRFYQHGGIDWRGVARAMMVNIFSGGIVQGGSTLTQQLAKNLFLTHERTWSRKLREVMIAYWLERYFTKDKILTLYLNRVYFGAGTYGVAAASEKYFRLPVTRLNRREAAVLIGLLKAPSRLNPLVRPEAAAGRGDQVLLNMVDAGLLGEDEAKKAAALPLRFAKGNVPAGSRYFADWVLDGLPEYIGYPEEDIVVLTTMSLVRQQAAEKILTETLNASGLQKNVSQGALLSLSATGAVVAMVGGIDYEFSQFNRVTQAQRQPGSAFKLFVAAAALEEGYTPDSTLEDTPLAIEGWVPENFHDQHLGTVTLQQAFAQSLNVPMVRLAQAVGISKVTALARAMGIKSPIRQNLSSALGSSEVNLLELTSAYATVAAEGYQVRPYGVVRITTKKGRELYVTPNRLTKRVLSPVGLAGLQQLLSSVLYSPGGTGTAARLDAIAGGKTGTSQDFRDAWFLGSAEDITTGVWMGNDDNTPMDRVTGGSLPARVWATYMRQALQLQNDIQ